MVGSTRGESICASGECPVVGRARVRGVKIVGPSSKGGHEVRKTKESASREMTKVRASVWVLAVLMITGSAAGCGQVSDRAQQEAEKKVENKGQQAREEAKEKLNAKQQEAK